MGWMTDLLVALLGLFLALDGVAHLLHYRYGETFSALVWHLESGHPLVRALVGAACLTLFTHLVFRVP